ncbi:MAG: hypothetical protein R3F43_21630 [bacterium]
MRHVDQWGARRHPGLLREAAQINVQQMENIVFSGARAACARIQLEDAPSDAVLAALAEDAAIFEVKLVELVG